MKKLLFSAWLLMLSMVATAQSFVIVDKNGNKTTYDVSKLDSVTFQQTPPSFTVYKEADPEPSQGGETPAEPKQETTTFTFDEVQSIAGDPKFLFAHPDTVYVGADGQNFAFQLRSNVTYDYTPSDRWLTFGHTSDDTDSLYFAAAMNPNTRQRLGYIAFVNKNDATMRDTIYVVQYGKRDSRYIDINWERTSIESYNRETGRAVLVFQDPIPVMGDHDVTLLPGTETYEIRIIDDVQQLSDTKVQIDTREGKMGNLFKDQQFTLCSDPNYDPTSDSGSSSGGGTKPSSAPVISGPIIYPETIELMQNGKPVAEVYNRAMRRDSKLEKEFNIFEYNYDNSGAVIWEKGAHNVSWQECKFDVGLKGIFAFDFGDVEWENVRFGDLKNFKAYLDGDFNTDLILKYTLTKDVEASVEKTLVKDIFAYRVKFMVGPVPVWVNLSSDLMASVEAKAEAQVSVSGGVRAHANLKGGVEWDADRGTHPISSFDYQYEIVKPEVEAEAHAEAKAYVWPQINIGIYDVLAPTINPKPYVRAYADARSAEANKPFFGWNAGISAGLDLTLSLDLKLWKWRKTLAEIDPINLVDRDLVAVPTKVELEGDTLSRVLLGTTHDVKYTVKGHNSITGADYNIPGALLKVESLGGGKIDKESGYYYTGLDGTATVQFEQTDTIPGYLKVTLITGDEERDAKCRNWRSEVVDFRFTAIAEDNQISATRSGKAEAEFLLETYSKKKADVNGYWDDAYGYKVGFSVSGGKLDADTVITSTAGRAIVNFDGGEGFSGGSITAKVIIAEFDTTYTQTLTVNKFSFDDPHLAKAYNLPNNTVDFDDDKLDIIERKICFHQYVEQGHANTVYKLEWKAEKAYETEAIGGVVKHMRKQVLGSNTIEAELIFDNKAAYDPDHAYNGAWVDANAYDYWADIYQFSPERTTAIQQWNELLKSDSDAVCPDERYYFWDKHTMDEFNFNKWSTNVVTFGGGNNFSIVEDPDTGRDYKLFGHYVMGIAGGQGKQIIFEEGDKYVFLLYRVKDNGDAVHVKAVFSKSEIKSIWDD